MVYCNIYSTDCDWSFNLARLFFDFLHVIYNPRNSFKLCPLLSTPLSHLPCVFFAYFEIMLNYNASLLLVMKSRSIAVEQIALLIRSVCPWIIACNKRAELSQSNPTVAHLDKFLWCLREGTAVAVAVAVAVAAVAGPATSTC